MCVTGSSSRFARRTRRFLRRRRELRLLRELFSSDVDSADSLSICVRSRTRSSPDVSLSDSQSEALGRDKARGRTGEGAAGVSSRLATELRHENSLCIVGAVAVACRASAGAWPSSAMLGPGVVTALAPPKRNSLAAVPCVQWARSSELCGLASACASLDGGYVRP